MSTVNEVRETLEQHGEHLARDPQFCELQEFYQEMVKDGLVLRQEYSLPPLDTVGREIYHSLAAAKDHD